MATTETVTCHAPDAESELLPLSPFSALHYHFGMLLGEEDFKTDQGYHRAKMRLHNAWLHREGVVWGFRVTVDQDRGEIKVGRGLALDSAGHELHLDREWCVNVGKWFKEHKDDPELTVNPSNAHQVFNGHVVVRFKACLTRQVPSLMEPCNNAGTSTAYSRTFETIEILLLPNLAAVRKHPYHRLRLLFGIDPPTPQEGSPDPVPEDKAVLDEIKRIKALPTEQQAAEWLKAFHLFAALDEMELKPASTEQGVQVSIFPGPEDTTLLLANVSNITVEGTNDEWKLISGTVDNSVRPVHVATTTVQDLLSGLLSGPPEPPPPTVGPRVSAATIGANEIVLDFDLPLQEASVKPEAFSVSMFDSAGGWTVFTIKAELDATRQKVTLAPDPSPPELGIGLARVIARGTGATPLLGDDQLPLAGGINDQPVPQGLDYVLLRKKES
jgi:hypothetical protein